MPVYILHIVHLYLSSKSNFFSTGLVHSLTHMYTKTFHQIYTHSTDTSILAKNTLAHVQKEPGIDWFTDFLIDWRSHSTTWATAGPNIINAFTVTSPSYHKTINLRGFNTGLKKLLDNVMVSTSIFYTMIMYIFSVFKCFKTYLFVLWCRNCIF